MKRRLFVKTLAPVWPVLERRDDYGWRTWLAVRRADETDLGFDDDANPYRRRHLHLASSGGILETKKIGDRAMEHGVPMAMHFAGTPISFMANVHCAATT